MQQGRVMVKYAYGSVWYWRDRGVLFLFALSHASSSGRFKMGYCAPNPGIMRSIHLNHFETTIHLNHAGAEQKKTPMP